MEVKDLCASLIEKGGSKSRNISHIQVRRKYYAAIKLQPRN